MTEPLAPPGGAVRVDLPDRRRAQPLRRVALAVPAVVLFVAAAVLGLQVRADGAQQRVRNEAVQAAEDEAVAVTSVSADDPGAGVARVLSAATGTFRTAYEQQSAGLRATVRDEDVRSAGQVLDSGVVRAGARSAAVVVVVEAQVRNRAQPTPQPRRYRMQLGLERVGSRWLTSSLEVLP